jgi:hypothetical protein
VRKELRKIIGGAGAAIGVDAPEYILRSTVGGNVYYLHAVGNKRQTADAVSLGVKQYVVALIVLGSVYLYKVVTEWSYEYKISPPEFVFSILNNVRGVAADKVYKLIVIVRVHIVRIAGKTAGYLVLEKYFVCLPYIVLHFQPPIECCIYSITAVQFLQYKNAVFAIYFLKN